MRRKQTLTGVLAALGLAGAGLGGPAMARGPGPEPTPATAVGGPLAAQEKQLRTTLAQTAAVVVRSADALELWYPVRLAFVPDGTELLPSGATLLDLLARSLREYEHSQVVVAVYTDAIGGSEYNQGQSQARAAVLVEALQARGVDAARLVARGMGETVQLEAPDTAEGRDLNRRVQFVITPLSS